MNHEPRRPSSRDAAYCLRARRSRRGWLSPTDRFLHLAHRPLHADEHRAADDAVADVQLLDAGDARRPACTLW